jgi:hypothetical protein
VRFQTSESIPSQDPEIVLRALETCLRDVATDIVRTGLQITMRGLGPSPRVINRRDTAVLRVESEADQTVINADVTFQASAFLGDVPQDDVVRSKLNRVFEQMKMQLDLDHRRASRLPSPPVTQSTRSTAEETASPPPTPEVRLTTPNLAEPSLRPQPPIRKSEPIESKPVKPESEPIQPQLVEQQPAHEQPPSTVVAARPPATKNISDTPCPNNPPPYKMVWEPAPQAAILPVSSAASYALKTVVVLAASVILLGPSLYLVRHHASATTLPTPPPTTTQPLAVSPKPLTTTQPSASTTPPPTTILPPTPTPPPPAKTASLPSASSAALNASDPKVWLQNWVAAMRTRDAAAQASFYADPTDRYLGKSNVSKADILQDKHVAIVNREGLWTVKLEEITLNRQSEDEVTVHLVKHYMAETEPAQISEQFVPSRLKLRRINNQWKIISEQDED